MRAVRQVCPRVSPHWVGDGFHVFPLFAHMAFTKAVSPFLMFDYAAPKQFAPSRKTLGVGKHPHRGFETVTIAFQGEVEHRDSLGHTGVIGKGGVQWMTAARGIVHEEYHSKAFAQTGGTFEMAQIWVNLPKKHKMDPPRYQPIDEASIPTAPLRAVAADGACEAETVGQVRVIAGAFDGVAGPAQTMTPIEMWDLKLSVPAARVRLSLPEGHNVMLLVRRGAVHLEADGRDVLEHTLAIFETTGGAIELSGVEADTEVLLLAGEPIDEPIAARGPFVMNTQEEIMEALRDYSNGKMG